MTTRHRILIVLSLGVLAAAAPGARGRGRASASPRTVTIGRIAWQTDLESARALARREDKPLWVHFGENPG